MRFGNINRKVLGILGLALPGLAIICSIIHSEPILPSISHYYHTAFQPVIIGLGFLMGLAFFTLNSNTHQERIMYIFLGLCAIFVALLPTPLRNEILQQYPNTLIPAASIIEHEELTKLGHFIFASLFFITSAYLILIHFVSLEHKKEISSNFRIIVYKVCGWGMCLAIGFLAIFHLLFPSFLAWSETQNIPITLALETVALLFFGIAWFVKSKPVSAKIDALNIKPPDLTSNV